MSRLYDGLRISRNLENLFRSTAQKGSSKLLASESYFEQNLSKIMEKLRPKDISDIFSLHWLTQAIETLSEAHISISKLVADIQLPASDWNDKLIDTCLDSSIKVLDVCNALSTELNRLNQGQLFLRYGHHILASSTGCLSSEKLRRIQTSFRDWLKKTDSTSSKLDSCNSILQSLKPTLCLSKSKVSPKERVLMRAFYGVEVITLFVCTVVTAVLTGSSKPLIDLHIVGKFLWLEAFLQLQAFLHEGIRTELSHGKVRVLKEIAAVRMSAQMFLPSTNGIDCKDESTALSIDIKTNESNALSGSTDHEERQKLLTCVSVLTDRVGLLGRELDSFSKQVNNLFQTLITERDALLCNLRASNVSKREHLRFEEMECASKCASFEVGWSGPLVVSLRQLARIYLMWLAPSYNRTLPPGPFEEAPDDEIVSSCSGFLNAGTDTTSTTLQRIMAELVHHREDQDWLFTGGFRDSGREAEEERRRGRRICSFDDVLEGDGDRKAETATAGLRTQMIAIGLAGSN